MKMQSLIQVCACALALSLPLASHADSLVFAFAENEAPISHRTDDAVTGTLPDVTRLIFSLLNDHQVEPVTLPWPRAQRMVESGMADGFVTYPSQARREYAVFTEQPVYYIDIGYLIYHRDNPHRRRIESARSFEDLRGLTFIGQNGAEWERENIPDTLETVMAGTLEAMMHLLIRRRTGDFMVMPPEQAIYLARYLGYRSEIRMRHVDFIPNSRIPFHLGVSQQREDAQALVDAVDAVVTSDTFQRRRQRLIETYRE